MYKYFKHLKKERVRISSPNHEYLEMHRAARIDFYSKKIKKEIQKHLQLTHLNRYPKIEELYQKIAQFHNINENNILITSGIDGGIKTVFEMCTNKNSTVLCLTPTYAMYHVYSDVFETKLIEIQTEKETLKITPKTILNQINKNIDILFLPNPHQPIENVFTLKELEKILLKAKKNDVLVFVDEAYYMFDAPTALPLIPKYDNLIVARTFSKGFGLPGIRIGYLLSNDNLINYLSSKRFAHETSSISCQIAMWAIDNVTIFQEYTKTVCTTRKWLKKKLYKHGFKTHGQMSNTILIDLKSSYMVEQISKELKNANILVRSNIPKPFDNFIMVTIGSKNKTSLFLKSFLSLYKNHPIKNSLNN